MFIGFLPKLVLRSAILRPLSVPNVSPIGACIRVLWRILQSVPKEVRRREREKRKTKKKTKLWPLVSRKWPEQFSSNLECSLPYRAGTCAAKLVSIRSGITELQRCENHVYSLPVTILTVWRAGFLGRMTHYRVS